MARTIIQLIKACAQRLRGSKLSRLGGKEISEDLDKLVSRLALKGRDEAVVFIAVFENSCMGRSADLDDMARYFDCTVLDMMEYTPALRSLMQRGLIALWDTGECNIVSQNFTAPSPVMNSILDNRMPSYEKSEDVKGFDRYDFCKLVDNAIQDKNVSALALMQLVADMENTNAGMEFVRNSQAVIPEIRDRALFYEVCYDFYNGARRNQKTDVDSTLEDMYASFGERISERKKLVDGTSPLIVKGLVEMNLENTEATLSEEGRKLLLEDDFGSFGEKLESADRYAFINMVWRKLHDESVYDSGQMSSLNRLYRHVAMMEISNRHLSCVSKLSDIIKDAVDRVVFYFACKEPSEGIDLSRELRTLFPERDRLVEAKKYKDGKSVLQKLGIVEVRSESSFFGERTMLCLTDKGKELFFEEDAELFIEQVSSKDMIRPSGIVAKHLFFADGEQRQLSMVAESLKEENYKSLTARLEAKGLSKGLAVLLYGAPGTGKTESVMQWARETGRDIVHVDLSASKSMWYGESEKIVKGIFTRYRNLCKRSTLKPILLFNEADGLFSRRKDISAGAAVDQTENTIQNILLEEMEKLDGILVATTNLESNLDAAFERRFLFKIKLGKPGLEAKRNIWRDKMPSLSVEQAGCLASAYDFSGGEIDNIVRKATLQEVLDGTAPDFVSLERLCSEERIGRSGRGRVGF